MYRDGRSRGARSPGPPDPINAWRRHGIIISQYLNLFENVENLLYHFCKFCITIRWASEPDGLLPRLAVAIIRRNRFTELKECEDLRGLTARRCAGPEVSPRL
jgi:hypothetical protein